MDEKKDDSLNMEIQTWTEEMQKAANLRKKFRNGRKYQKRKVRDKLQSYYKKNGGHIDKEKEREIAKPYLDECHKDTAYVYTEFDAHKIQELRGSIKGYDNGRSPYREKKNGKYTSRIISAGDTSNTESIDNVSKSIEDMSTVNLKNSMRVSNYKDTIEIRKQQGKLNFDSGTDGAR